MPAVVLESFLGSEYEDTPSSYEFPERYRRFFEPLDRGIPMFAVVYEPRGDDGRGRMAYVALAAITQPPSATGRRSEGGQRLWRVEYSGPARPFDVAVPREILGEPVETWLQPVERGRPRNVATFGRAVRLLSDPDFQRILELGNAAILENPYSIAEEHAGTSELVAERARRTVEAFEREAQFRERVLDAYGYRCSVSGFDLGSVARTKPHGLIDAAHIRPVARGGPDAVSNGLSLTPTLHRLFDAGLFTVAYDVGVPSLLVSPRLEPSMVETIDRGFILALRDGLPLMPPKRQEFWPHPEQLRYHQREVFRAT